MERNFSSIFRGLIGLLFAIMLISLGSGPSTARVFDTAGATEFVENHSRIAIGPSDFDQDLRSAMDRDDARHVRVAQRRVPGAGGPGGGRVGGGGGASVVPGAVFLGIGILRSAPRRTRPPTPRDNLTAAPRTPKKKVKRRKVVRRAPARKPVDVPLPDFRNKEVLVLLSGSQPDTASDAIARRHGLVKKEALDVALLQGRVQKYDISGPRNVSDVVAVLATDPDVIMAQPNNLYRPLGAKTKSRAFAKQYALAKLGVRSAHELAKGRGVPVAVIDTAIDTSHPALASAIVKSFDAVRDGKALPHSHGTAIAGVISGSGKIQGVAPMAGLYAVRAFYVHPVRKTAETSSFILLRAFEWAAAEGARVFNMSFAGPSDPLVNTVLNITHANGIVHVAAAGNGGPKAPPAYPAAYKSVIAITALDHKDRLYKLANRGSYVAVAAPGVDVYVPALKKRYTYSSGTSVAAAHVSGQVALMMEKDPAASAKTIIETIVATAHDLGPKGHDVLYGAGRVDAHASLVALSTD